MSVNRDSALRSVRFAEAEAIRAGEVQEKSRRAAAQNVRWTSARIALFLRLWPTVMLPSRILEEMNKLDTGHPPISLGSMSPRASYYSVRRLRLPAPPGFEAGEKRAAPRGGVVRRAASVEASPLNTEDRHTALELLRRGKAETAEDLVGIFGCELAEALEIVDGWREAQLRRVAA